MLVPLKHYFFSFKFFPQAKPTPNANIEKEEEEKETKNLKRNTKI